ncbi:MAG: hypothetical protein HY654_00095 [Acidobacteria bacterium]|nr:hypothetical protein [Acidobacteriota bacterium]
MSAVDRAGLTVSVTGGTGAQYVPRDTIQRIQLVRVDRADSLKNGAIIGASVGAGYALGVLIYIAAGGEGGEPASRYWVEGPAIGAAIGAAAGVLVDRLKAGKQKVTIYVR